MGLSLTRTYNARGDLLVGNLLMPAAPARAAPWVVLWGLHTAGH